MDSQLLIDEFFNTIEEQAYEEKSEIENMCKQKNFTLNNFEKLFYAIERACEFTEENVPNAKRVFETR